MKVEEVLKKLNYDELEILFEDLKEGGIKTKKQIFERMENTKQKDYCAICFKELSNNDNKFSLLFGPDNMRMKANFCEVDCLLNFISKLKNVKNDKTFSESIAKMSGVGILDESKFIDNNESHEKKVPNIPKFSFE